MKQKKFLRNVVAAAICLAGMTILTGCPSDDPTAPDSDTTTPTATEAIELTSPITANTTLKDLGLPVDYIYRGGLLSVENNAVLTIDPGVTIQFTDNSGRGGITITSGATIKAIGTAAKRIQFIGAYEATGTWAGIEVRSNTDNQFAFCDFLNAGSFAGANSGSFYLFNAKAGFSHCKFTNGLGTGIYAGCDAIHYCEFSAFDNNVFQGYQNYPPMYLDCYQSLSMLEKLDMTSDFTNNAMKYIEINPDITKAVTLSQTTVPYYFSSSIEGLEYTLTINDGVTVYVAGNNDFISTGHTQNGKLMINGTTAKPVKITRLPSSSNYWGGISFEGLKGSVLNNCILEYGGNISGAYHGNMIYITYGSQLTLNNVQLNNAQAYGVYINACAGEYVLTHSNVTFSGNGEGNVDIWCEGDHLVSDLP